ncbi:hypothetical protein B9Q13_03810 [Candidatus Marsarchaeota G2 archaeon ECH_B_SAG-G16]|uniref:Uncharacterized protein n=1 Tax=Candidatus Marsarchaeota G2 archaeon ECH_B_SAG-G16 TaxID=1978167 RepID=A0A2R6C1D5_9ARCH|nr:MAG: hypothetical protein B9Q13_03810 [Candidatus Marsarchaeota G2 archaeon ECH_B_SAG-G16]
MEVSLSGCNERTLFLKLRLSAREGEKLAKELERRPEHIDEAYGCPARHRVRVFLSDGFAEVVFSPYPRKLVYALNRARFKGYAALREACGASGEWGKYALTDAEKLKREIEKINRQVVRPVKRELEAYEESALFSALDELVRAYTGYGILKLSQKIKELGITLKQELTMS